MTGLRLGKPRGLRAGDIDDVPYPCLIVHCSLLQSVRTGAVVERAPTKAGTFRIVPLVDHIRPVVFAWTGGNISDELLFSAPNSGYLNSQDWRCKVHCRVTARGRRPHDLRHTATSVWIAAGMDIKTISSWLGHSSAKLTLDIYGHLMGTDADRAALD